MGRLIDDLARLMAGRPSCWRALRAAFGLVASVALGSHRPGRAVAQELDECGCWKDTQVCCKNPDGAFRGCCVGVCCAALDGTIGACCNDTETCCFGTCCASGKVCADPAGARPSARPARSPARAAAWPSAPTARHWTPRPAPAPVAPPAPSNARAGASRRAPTAWRSTRRPAPASVRRGPVARRWRQPRSAASRASCRARASASRPARRQATERGDLLLRMPGRPARVR